MHHVKPHGKLYGMMCKDYDVAKAVMLGIKPFNVPDLRTSWYTDGESS